MVDHVREHSKRHVKALYLTQICSLSFETETETIYDFPNKKNVYTVCIGYCEDDTGLRRQGGSHTKGT